MKGIDKNILIRHKIKSNIKLKRPKAPHNTTTYLIENRSIDYILDEFKTGGTMKGILSNTLDLDSTDEGSLEF
jgi:hypothetical protein